MIMEYHTETAKFEGVMLDVKLQWKEHVNKKKREEFGIKIIEPYWLNWRISTLSLHNTLLLYKQVLKPV